MNMTNLAYEEEINNETFGLPEGMWDYLVTEMKRVFRFTRKETKWFKNCKTAQLIATIPFAAGCNEPERTAIAHLTIYLAEIRGFQKYYAHLPSDDADLFQRLKFISTFEGGNPEVIEYGMNRLAMIMIEGYHKSEDEDQKNGVYNPFVSDSWNYEELELDLHKKLLVNAADFEKIDFYTNSPIRTWRDF